MSSTTSYSAAIVQSVVPEKSQGDECAYRVITLANGMEAVLCHDKEADKAAAALDVQVGQFSDPSHAPGLAHFCEHMLFLGTEKYPDESSYSATLSKYGGNANAWTDVENTNYQFDVVAEHLEEMLDRFSQFFIKPLFTASATEREMMAVHSEHQKNLQSDMWRIREIVRATTNPNHPISQFGTGCLETLRDLPASKGINTRDELLVFHKKFYSANRMKLAIVGKEPLDTLANWACKYFGAVENKNVESPTFSRDILIPGSLPRVFRIVPVKDSRSVSLMFFLPPDMKFYHSSPLDLLANMIGHEGKGSILSCLKHAGWANELNAGRSEHTTCFSEFGIDIDLTEAGLKNVMDVLQVVFGYISILKEASDNDLRVQFGEFRDLAEMKFRFKNKEQPFSYATTLAHSLQYFDAQDVLSANYVHRKEDLDTVRKFLGLFAVESARIHIVSKEFAGKTDKKEKWYGTEYSEVGLNATEIDFLKKTSARSQLKALHLPLPNAFIATDFSLRDEPLENDAAAAIVPRSVNATPPAEPHENIARHDGAPSEQKLDADQAALERFAKIPPVRLAVGIDNVDIAQNSGKSAANCALTVPPVQLWFKLDRVFKKPKVNVYMRIESPVTYSTPRNHVLSSLYTLLLTDNLNEISYDASIAGLKFSVNDSADGIHVTFSGYNHKLPVLLDAVLSRLRSLQVDHSRFELIKEKLGRSYRNFDKDAPIRQVRYAGQYATQMPMWHVHEKVAVVGGIVAADVQAHVESIFSTCALLMLVHGNASREEAVSLAKRTYSALKTTPLLASQGASITCSKFPDSHTTVHQFAVRNAAEPNSAVHDLYQLGPCLPQLYAVADVLQIIAAESAFDTLRTKETLGYIASAGVVDLSGILHFHVSVQSLRAADYVDGRIEAWIHNVLLPFIQTMDEADFKKQTESVIQQTAEKDTRLSQETNRMWSEIHAGLFLFDRRERQIAVLKALKKTDIIALIEEKLLANATRRCKLSLQAFGIQAILPDPAKPYAYPSDSLESKELKSAEKEPNNAEEEEEEDGEEEDVQEDEESDDGGSGQGGNDDERSPEARNKPRSLPPPDGKPVYVLGSTGLLAFKRGAARFPPAWAMQQL